MQDGAWYEVQLKQIKQQIKLGPILGMFRKCIVGLFDNVLTLSEWIYR